MSMAKFDTVETPENHEVKPPEVIEDTESIKSGDGESGIDSEIEDFAKMGEDETSNETSNETKESPEDSEVKNSYAEGMSEADKEAYGISSEIEDFVKTGQIDDVELPSEMQNEGVDTLEGSEKNENLYAEGMTEEDKEAYGISSEIEDFVKTGQMDEVKLPSEMQEEAADALEDSEVTENPYADGMSEEDKEAYGISSEIEDFVKTGQMDDVKLPSEMQEEGEMVKEFENKLSDNIESESLSDEKVDDSPTIFQKASAVAGMFLASLGANYDSTSDVLDALNKEQTTEIHEILEDEKDLGQKSADEFGENLVDAVGGIAEAFQNKDEIEVVNLPSPEGSDGSEGEGGGEAVEMNTSFEQDGTTLQEAWNTDVDNVAYDQNDDE